jgi:SAM-dependent methyltransferase
MIQLHKCKENGIRLNEKFDFIMAFYMFHELPNQQATLREFKTLLNPDGRILIVEPKIHVPKKDFEELEKRVLDNGFQISERPNIFFSRSMMLSV